jgi:two-component system, LytTR family, sensor kinase
MKLKHHILLHTLFWLLFLGLPLTSALLSEKDSPGLYPYLILFGSINILNFYTCYFLISRFVLKSSRSLKNLWILIPVIIVFASLRMLGEAFVGYLSHTTDSQPMFWYIALIRHCINTLIYTVISLLITFFVGWVSAQKQKDELEKQNQRSELALLRSQINPHFLFNTLNNLYSLVYRKSDDAPGALMKLSEILRYMLHDSNAEKVPMEKEITYIRSYIELQQLRLSTPNFIELDVRGNVEGKLIPPMLLITFIENAFKHGSKNIPAPGIIISIHCIEDEFTFEITSYLVNGQVQQKDPQKGIGLQNVKRRLELLYPGRHDLLVGLGENKFYVKLRIDEL